LLLLTLIFCINNQRFNCEETVPRLRKEHRENYAQGPTSYIGLYQTLKNIHQYSSSSQRINFCNLAFDVQRSVNRVCQDYKSIFSKMVNKNSCQEEVSETRREFLNTKSIDEQNSFIKKKLDQIKQKYPNFEPMNLALFMSKVMDSNIPIFEVCEKKDLLKIVSLNKDCATEFSELRNKYLIANGEEKQALFTGNLENLSLKNPKVNYEHIASFLFFGVFDNKNSISDVCGKKL